MYIFYERNVVHWETIILDKEVHLSGESLPMDLDISPILVEGEGLILWYWHLLTVVFVDNNWIILMRLLPCLLDFRGPVVFLIVLAMVPNWRFRPGSRLKPNWNHCNWFYHINKLNRTELVVFCPVLHFCKVRTLPPIKYLSCDHITI